MRIIDNKYDFYDYLQDYTDTIVFDRRGSFYLTKEMICDHINSIWWRHELHTKKHMLIQCGATFWLIVLAVTEFNSLNKPSNYIVSLVDCWKNYDKPNRLLDIQFIKFRYTVAMNGYRVEDMKNAVDHDEMLHTWSINHSVKYIDYKGEYKKEESEMPILISSGLGDIIDPVDMFCAIEEYFSIEKTKAETTEPKGITNNDKIVMHGFDTKKSFRGKQS